MKSSYLIDEIQILIVLLKDIDSSLPLSWKGYVQKSAVQSPC